MSFVAVATLDELRGAEPLAVEHDDHVVALVQVEEQIFAIKDECSHARVPLSEGDVEDCAIECYLHGARFDLRTGAAISLPATEPVPVYPVRVEGTDILVDFDHPNTTTQES